MSVEAYRFTGCVLPPERNLADDPQNAHEAGLRPRLRHRDAGGGYRIGSDLRMNATWNDGVVFSTPHKDFSLHIGGWVQYDNVFWDQSSALRIAPDGRPGAKQGVASGAALGGIGDLQDDTYF